MYTNYCCISNHIDLPKFEFDQLLNLVTALVPSEMACLASSPGKRSFTADYTDLDPKVFLPPYLAKAADSVAN